MPWKLVLFVIVLVLITIFAGFNLDNKCTISFVFKTVENVSVFLSLMFAFLAGMIIMLPFTVKTHRKSEKKSKNEKPNKSLTPVPTEVVPMGPPVVDTDKTIDSSASNEADYGSEI